MSGWFGIRSEYGGMWDLNNLESRGGVVWFDGGLGGCVVFVLLLDLLQHFKALSNTHPWGGFT